MSPFAWYFARIRCASSVLPWAQSHRGDSGLQWVGSIGQPAFATVDQSSVGLTPMRSQSPEQARRVLAGWKEDARTSSTRCRSSQTSTTRRKLRRPNKTLQTASPSRPPVADVRAQKVQNIAADIPEQEVSGPTTGDLLVVSWGGTYGACYTAVQRAREQGRSVAHAHLRYLNPFPRNLEQLIRGYKNVLVPELNMGQLSKLIRQEYLIDTQDLNKVKGKPFTVNEVLTKINEVMA